MTLSIRNGGYAFWIGFNVFYVIMKGVPFITNFKRTIRHLIKLILYENDVKLLKFKRSPV